MPPHLTCTDAILANRTLVPDSAFSASSVLRTNLPDFLPHQARVENLFDDQGTSGHAWCPRMIRTGEPKPWIQVDLGRLHRINRVVVYGRGKGNYVEYAETVSIQYQREEGETWHTYKEADGTSKSCKNKAVFAFSDGTTSYEGPLPWAGGPDQKPLNDATYDGSRVTRLQNGMGTLTDGQACVFANEVSRPSIRS
ncbi:hypothetical protein Ciccas_001479 [Cichlidogyrus casuarinus]|uniref:F5/8 type C domain-containing protein n=1 Tax=Cichlidogyrus casuarinus TaxID=1844966 RepID=A0ABD2QJY6_9PLAT